MIKSFSELFEWWWHTHDIRETSQSLFNIMWNQFLDQHESLQKINLCVCVCVCVYTALYTAVVFEW